MIVLNAIEYIVVKVESLVASTTSRNMGTDHILSAHVTRLQHLVGRL